MKKINTSKISTIILFSFFSLYIVETKAEDKSENHPFSDYNQDVRLTQQSNEFKEVLNYSKLYPEQRKKFTNHESEVIAKNLTIFLCNNNTNIWYKYDKSSQIKFPSGFNCKDDEIKVFNQKFNIPDGEDSCTDKPKTIAKLKNKLVMWVSNFYGCLKNDRIVRTANADQGKEPNETFDMEYKKIGDSLKVVKVNFTDSEGITSRIDHLLYDKNGKFTGEKTIIPKRIEPKAQEEESSTNN